MNKLNFGCGGRVAANWTNIDFHSDDSRVKRVNLLAGLPFPDNYFDVVYSSHVLEHFTRDQGLFLIREAHRVLKPGAILRIVVPDLEGSCREYLRILAKEDSDPSKQGMYEWILVELLDQLVRSSPSGEMGRLINSIMLSKNEDYISYVRSRTENTPWNPPRKTTIKETLQKLSFEKVTTKIHYWYLRAVARLIPKHLRSMVFVETGIGERHRWMYDWYGLNLLLQNAGFENICELTFNTSSIRAFTSDCLDSLPDGTSYKNNSVYCEASKRPKEGPYAPGTGT
jgi:SAM-dependent methyltransferase